MRTASAQILLIAAIAGSQSGCEPSPELPITGKVLLEHVRSTPTGPEFRLANQSRFTVKIEADPTEDAYPKPRYVKWSCKETPSSEWKHGSAPMLNRYSTTFSLEPGFETKLFVTREMQPPGWSQHGRCRIAVVRADGQPDILSGEFPQ